MKKQDIFDTTLALVVRQGLHATPMAQIAQESNVAVGTIYHYFSSKEQIIHELYLGIHQDLENEIYPEEIDTNSYQVEFTSLCLSVFKFFIQYPLKFNFLQQYEHSPLRFQNEKMKQYVEFPISQEFFISGLQLDLFKAIPMSVISNLIYENISALANLQLSENIVLNKEIIQTVIDGCWNMIQK